MARYSVARLDEMEEIDDGRTTFRPVRHHFGIATFGATAAIGHAAGDTLINEHEEAEPDSSEELYVVVAGRARFEIDGDVLDTPTGTYIHVPAHVQRAAYAEEAGTTVLAIGAGAEGRPYAVTGWELFTPLFALFESGAYEEGADRAEALLADLPPFGAHFFNTACFESLAGRTDKAVAHLRRAVELQPSLAALARDDEDFAPLREHPDWAEIVGA